MRCIKSGKIEKFNVVQEKLSTAHIRPLKKETVAVLIYDTDVQNIDKLQWNIHFLNEQSVIEDVVCIPQVQNLEDELQYACDIKRITELTHSKTVKDFKRDLMRCSNLNSRLYECNFDILKLWSRVPQNDFKEFGNTSEKIKIIPS